MAGRFYQCAPAVENFERCVVVVPNTAVQNGPASAYVFVVQDDNTVKMQNIKIAVWLPMKIR